MPAIPTPTQPKPDETKPIQPNPVRPNPSQPDLTRSSPTQPKPNPIEPTRTHPNTSQRNPTQPNPTQSSRNRTSAQGNGPQIDQHGAWFLDVRQVGHPSKSFPIDYKSFRQSTGNDRSAAGRDVAFFSRDATTTKDREGRQIIMGPTLGVWTSG